MGRLGDTLIQIEDEQKGNEMPEKLYRINMNVDLKQVHPPLLIDKSKQKEGGGFGEMDAPSFFENIVLQAISQAHPTGSMASLRRTKSIGDKIGECKETGGHLDINQADYDYIKSSINKADKWNNDYNIAKSVIVVLSAVENAEVVE